MIDFHCHLDLYPDPEMAVRLANESGIYVLSVTTTPKAWRQTSSLAKNCPRIRTALGLHPQLAHERYHELPLFEGLIGETNYVGEVGLDGLPELKPHAAIQRRVFEAVLRISAKSGGRVLSIHSRRAVDDVLQCLRAQPDAGLPILHWFSGTRSQLTRALTQGCWLSVGPPMLRSDKGRALVASVPRDRILTETDGPFATGGSRPLMPSDVWSAVDTLGEIWGVAENEVRSILAENLRRVTASFRIQA